ncbi:MAG: phosphoglycerate kinase [Candidatus Aminicenantaceae bacterium]
MLSVKDLDLNCKTVFLRVDFNVPLDESGNIRNDARIRAALPTLEYLLDKGARVVAASHLGRPKGKVIPELSLKPVAIRLAEFIPQEVVFSPDCIGGQVDCLKQGLACGHVLLLENLRFYAEEKENDFEFARALARKIDYYVNDAFGTCHRAHASVVAITQFVKKAAAGFLVEKEVAYMGRLIHAPERPFTAILGGAKVSDKIPVIRNLIDKADDILIGGAMAYTFFQALGKDTGRSLVEQDKVELALTLLNEAKAKGINFHLPLDHVIAESMTATAPAEILIDFPFPADRMALDIGPRTVEAYGEIIQKSRTIFWNGPMGVFEINQFTRGTDGVAAAVADSEAISVVGGGDSVAALYKAGVQDRISHISTGGGASLEYLANETLSGLEALSEK